MAASTAFVDPAPPAPRSSSARHTKKATLRPRLPRGVAAYARNRRASTRHRAQATATSTDTSFFHLSRRFLSAPSSSVIWRVLPSSTTRVGSRGSAAAAAPRQREARADAGVRATKRAGARRAQALEATSAKSHRMLPAEVLCVVVRARSIDRRAVCK